MYVGEAKELGPLGASKHWADKNNHVQYSYNVETCMWIAGTVFI